MGIMTEQTITRCILEFGTTVEVAGVDLFEASKKFIPGKVIDGVEIGCVGGGFLLNFSDKVERNVPSAVLQVHRIRKSSIADPVLAELGGTPEMMLAHLWEVLKRQGRGQKGALLVNTLENFAPIRSTEGRLFTIDLARYSFDSAGWYVDAYPVEDRNQMDAGDQILSRQLIRPLGVSVTESSLTNLFRRPV